MNYEDLYILDKEHDEYKLRQAEPLKLGREFLALAIFFFFMSLAISAMFYSLGRAINSPVEEHVTQADREFCAGPNLNETFCHDKGLK